MDDEAKAALVTQRIFVKFVSADRSDISYSKELYAFRMNHKRSFADKDQAIQ